MNTNCKEEKGLGSGLPFILYNIQTVCYRMNESLEKQTTTTFDECLLLVFICFLAEIQCSKTSLNAAIGEISFSLVGCYRSMLLLIVISIPKLLHIFMFAAAKFELF